MHYNIMKCVKLSIKKLHNNFENDWNIGKASLLTPQIQFDF